MNNNSSNIRRSSQNLLTSKQAPWGPHSCQKLPPPINPAYVNHYTNKTRVDFLRYVASQKDLMKTTETILLEEFAKKNRIPYRESHDPTIRTYVRQLHVGIDHITEKKKEKLKPKLRYFNMDDSDVEEQDIQEVMNYKKYHKHKKGEDIPLDRIFKERNIDRYINDVFISQHQ